MPDKDVRVSQAGEFPFLYFAPLYTYSEPVKDRDKKKKKYIPTISNVLDDGTLLELLVDTEERTTTLVHGKGNSWTITSSHPLDDETKLIPYRFDNNLIQHHVILFPKQPEEYDDENRLISDIRSYIHRYLDISDAFLDIAAYYVLFTWLHDSFNELPYLRAMGGFGSGKTRFLLIIGSVCYKPIFASGASTVSPIFHILDSFGGTLIMDEADFRFSDEKAEVVKILNNGNVRGFPILRSELSPTTKEFNPRAFRVFGPKIVATRGQYSDQALESRFITETMGTRSLRPDIPINLPATHEQEALTLRNKLLLFRLRNFSLTNELADFPDRKVEPRLAQIFGPLLHVIHDETIRSHVQNLMTFYDKELSLNRSMDTAAQLLEAIHQCQQRNKPLTLQAIANTYDVLYGNGFGKNTTPRWVGGAIRRHLHLTPHKSGGIYHIGPDEQAKLPTLYQRYGVDVGDFGDKDSASAQ